MGSETCLEIRERWVGGRWSQGARQLLWDLRDRCARTINLLSLAQGLFTTFQSKKGAHFFFSMHILK